MAAASAPLLAGGFCAAALLLVAALAAPLCLRRRRPGRAVDPEKGPEEAARVRRYTWEQIEGMTDGFSTEVIGEGGYSKVYLARLEDGGSLAAVKVLRQGDSEMLHLSFEKELEALLLLRHRNVVSLLGFSQSPHGEEGALVFEYIPNGTLHEKLHCSAAAGEPLPWFRRVSIAYQMATALEHLHDLPIIHGDVKPSNILLDARLDAKLCDFGSAKLGFSSAVRPSPVLASPGYVDPHYMRTGMPSKRNDVYSFGVLLLEMVTGREAFCETRGALLTPAVAEVLGDEARVAELVDARLLGAYPKQEAVALARLAGRCVADGLRPSMGEVARVLAGVVVVVEEEEVAGKEKGGG